MVGHNWNGGGGKDSLKGSVGLKPHTIESLSIAPARGMQMSAELRVCPECIRLDQQKLFEQAKANYGSTPILPQGMDPAGPVRLPSWTQTHQGQPGQFPNIRPQPSYQGSSADESHHFKAPFEQRKERERYQKAAEAGMNSREKSKERIKKQNRAAEAVLGEGAAAAAEATYWHGGGGGVDDWATLGDHARNNKWASSYSSEQHAGGCGMKRPYNNGGAAAKAAAAASAAAKANAPPLELGTAEGEIVRILACGPNASALEVLGWAEPRARPPLDDVRKRYRQLAKSLHPDKCDVPKCADAFKRVSEAMTSMEAPPPAGMFGGGGGGGGVNPDPACKACRGMHRPHTCNLARDGR